MVVSVSPHTMRSLTRRTIFIYTNPSTSPYFLSSHFFSSTSYSISPHRHKAEESRNVKVSVWWDFENCSIPTGVNVMAIAKRITSTLRANGILGPITITAFGDFLQVSRANQEALSSTGVCLNHVPRGGKNSADRSLLVDLMCWVSQNPPPAHLLLISGDRDFANILHRLRMNNYNILLASSETVPAVLCSAASIMWQWNHLVRGKNVSGKHFSQPPDGPRGSWYEYYRGPLDDPFSGTGQSGLQTEKSYDLNTNVTVRPIPKAFVNQLQKILNLYPKGISITGLRGELARSTVTIDKDFFGYRNFSSLLKSLSTVLSLQHIGDGQFIVHAVQPKLAGLVDCSSRLTTGLEENTEKEGSGVNADLHGRSDDITKVSGKFLSPSNSPPKEEPPPLGPKTSLSGTSLFPSDSPPKDDPPPGPNDDVIAVSGNLSSPSSSPPKDEPSSLGPEKVVDHPTEDHPISIEQHGSGSEAGFIQRMWRTWFGGESSSSKKSNSSSAAHRIEEKKSKEDIVDSRSHGLDSSVLSSSSNMNISVDEGKTKMNSESLDSSVLSSLSNMNLSVDEGKTEINYAENDDKIKPPIGFFSKIVNWFRPLKSGTDVISTDAISTSLEFGNNVNQMSSQTEDHDLFSKETFWDEMETFLHTSNGLAQVSQSKTREDMAQMLQREGPPLLHNLRADDLLCLVDLLISEKQWVEENLLQFKVNLPAHKSSSPSKSHVSKELSSIFPATSSQLDSKRPPDHKRGNKDGNITQNGSRLTESKKKNKSHAEMLAGCQKLVAEILKEHPDGFNIGLFRDLFLEKYGYALDYRKLGHQKLATLLQTFPGVKLVDSYLFSSGRAPEITVPYMVESNKAGKGSFLDSYSSDSARKGDDQDNLWKELGPISEKHTTNRNDPKFGLHRKTKEKKECIDFDDNYFSDEFSDSEGESPIKDKSEKGATSNNDQDSSLLQILDSWYSKDSKGSKSHSNNVDKLVDSSKNDMKCSSVVGADNFSHVPRFPRKNYSFVSDADGDGKEKLIDNILGSLKKSPGSRVQT